MTYHNYGPTVNVINLQAWNDLSPEHKKLVKDLSMEAQKKIRELTESVDNFEKAKELLEAKGMKVNKANVEAFRKVAQEKIWPAYQKDFGGLWDEILKAQA
jgi:TRAP-type C4-dicarboxylate transport system substrate-binding protein